MKRGADSEEEEEDGTTPLLLPTFLPPSQQPQQSNPTMPFSTTTHVTATKDSTQSSFKIPLYGSTDGTNEYNNNDSSGSSSTHPNQKHDTLENSPRFNRLPPRRTNLPPDHSATTTTTTIHNDANHTTTPTPPKPLPIKNFLSYLIHATVNVIISVPGLYGYTAIIFNHAIFLSHRNQLAKLVILSSAVHQLAFTTCSSLPTFAIGTVQDAGLIFLSTMANHLVEALLREDGGDDDDSDASRSISPEREQVIVSTVLVLLSFGTATLGIVLILMGHFRLAEYVRQGHKFVCVYSAVWVILPYHPNVVCD